MIHNKEQKLIADLLSASVIDAEEAKKAELYLSLSSQTFDTHQGAVEWMIQNRAVRRDRQEQVRDNFNKANLDALSNTVKPAPETIPPVPVVNVEKIEPSARPAKSQEKTVYQPTAQPDYRTRSTGTSPIESIYHYNLKQLDRLVNEYPRFSAKKQTTRDNLKNCPFLFCDLSELDEWITSDYKTPFQIGLPGDLIDSTTALQLYSLFQKGLIVTDEYIECYLYLVDESASNKLQLPFSNEEALLTNLIENDCLNHLLTDRNLIKSYNQNMLLVQELIEQGTLNKLQTFLLKNLLENNPERRFNSSQQLLEWFIPQDVTKKKPSKKPKGKKKKVSLFFAIFVIYLIFRIITGISDGNKPKKPAAISPKPTVSVSKFDCSDKRFIQELQKRTDLNKRLSALGKLKNINPPKNFTNNSCKASATFENGSANIIFHVVTDEKTGAIALTDIAYDNIKINSGNNLNNAENAIPADKKNNAAPKGETVMGVKYDNDVGKENNAAVNAKNDASRNEIAVGVKYDNNANATNTPVVNAENVADADANDNTAVETENDNSAGARGNIAADIEVNSQTGSTSNDSAAPENRHVASNEYEAIVLKSLEDVDRLMAQRNPGSLKLLDIISDIKLSGQCRVQPHNNVTMCPFSVYYKDVWMKKDTVRNYKINVKFVSENNQLKLESQVDFIKKLTDEMYKNYRK